MSHGEENRVNAGENGGTFSLQWRRASYDVMTLHFEDGEYAGYYVVRHKTGHGPYYNGWHGDFRDRDLREYVSAGFDRDEVMKACEARAEKCLSDKPPAGETSST